MLQTEFGQMLASSRTTNTGLELNSVANVPNAWALITPRDTLAGLLKELFNVNCTLAC
jgi:hypothetical protein